MQVAMATATLTANALPSTMNKVEEKPEDITMKALVLWVFLQKETKGLPSPLRS